jgi:hypothetical protein
MLTMLRTLFAVHAWTYDDDAGTRQCSKCERKEQYEQGSGFASGSWILVSQGLKRAHNARIVLNL